MPFLPPIGPLAAPIPGVPGIPLPGLPRPDFGAIFDNQSQGAPASSVPLAPSGQSTPLLPPARSLGESALGPSASTQAGRAVGPRAGQTAMGIEPVFESIGNYLGSVNQLTQISDAKQRDLAMGKDVELHDVMIAAEKASVAVNLTTQIRNKLVESYQEVMRMQV
ncbi:Flagellar hook-basal body complex protein FliE [compost metagenome]